MNSVLVSVIIPAYNCAEYITTAIYSALAQDVKCEIIIVDDASTDNLDEVLAKFADRPNITVLKNETNLGVAASRNKGVSHAKGDYVAFLDGDDYWCIGKLRQQLEALQRTNTVLCTTARGIVLPNGDETNKVIPTREEITYKQLLRHNCINCSSVVLRREVALEFPMEHDKDSHEDYITWLKILKKYGKACGVNKMLFFYRQSNSGKSGGKLKSAKMTFKVYRYLGFGLIQSVFYFCSYALNGVYKHFIRRVKNDY